MTNGEGGSINKLAIVTAVAALVLGFAASDAAANHRENHHKGGGNDSFQSIFQAPFVVPGAETADTCKDVKPSPGNGECDGSEGKIASNGAYSVTILGVASITGGYDLCLDVNGDGDISDILGTCGGPGVCDLVPDSDTKNTCIEGLEGESCEIDEDCDVLSICTMGNIDESCVTNADCDLFEFVANASPAGTTLVFPGTDDGMCVGGTCTAGLTGQGCSFDEDCVASGNLVTDGIIGGGTLLDAPFFEVFSGADGTCPGGTLEFRSGMVIN